MSRSRKKSKIYGITTADSEKQDKRDANRKYRRIVKEKLKSGDETIPEIREVSDVWSFEKDGKTYNRNADEKILRK